MLSWNTALFLRLNAAVMPGAAMQALAEAAAGAPVVLAPVLLTCLWAWGSPMRRAALIAAGAGVFAGQGINMLLGLAWFDPRPFVAGAGHTWLGHMADDGFPSDHATLAWSLGLPGRCGGRVARVYLGVHFSADVLASVPAGLLAAGFARTLVMPVRRWVAPHVKHAYDTLLGLLPHRMRVAAGLARRSGEGSDATF